MDWPMDWPGGWEAADLLVGFQHAGRGAAAVDAQLAAGAFDQGVGAGLRHPHQGPDFLGQAMFAHQAQRLALPLGQQLDVRQGRGRRPVHQRQMPITHPSRSPRTPDAPPTMQESIAAGEGRDDTLIVIFLHRTRP